MMFSILRRPGSAAGVQKKELMAVLLSFKRTFVTIGLFSFVVNILMLVPTIYMLQIYDRVLTSRNQDTLIGLSVIMIAMFFVVGFLEWIRSQLLIRLGNRMDQKLSGKVFRAAFEKSLRIGSTNASQYFFDLTNIRQFLTGHGLFAFFDSPWTPIYIVVIYYMHPIMGVFSIVSAVFLLCMAVLTEVVSKKPLSEANKLHSIAGTFAGANLRNAEAIEAMGMMNHVRGHWYQKHLKFLKLQAMASERASVVSSITKVARLISQSLILGVGAYLAIQNIITPGMMIAASILMGRALSPVEMAIGTWKQFLSTRTSYERLEEILSVFPDREGGMSLPPPTGQLVVSNLIAGPPGTNKQILRGVSFAAEPGDIVAVIGPSAAGKTTLARMIVGIWQPLVGGVRLDGVEVSTWDKAELGPFIGYLPQDIELLDGTVAENIARFGAIDAEKVVAAAKDAGIHEMVLQFPGGYDTPIGEGGLVLSGGQKQRIALARAVYDDPVLIVLDEPNSNLDDAGELALLNTLVKLKEAQKTIFVITHRTSILSIVDKILLMINGVGQAYGPRDEVLASLQKAQQQQQQQQQSSGQGEAASVPRSRIKELRLAT
jgi:PrtD family type I secretion system ABC transporter